MISSVNDEDDIRCKLHPEVVPILKKKNFATWGRLLKEMGYEDEHLLEEVIAGFPLARKATRSHIFEEVRDEEPIDIDKLARGLSWRNRALSSKIKSSGSAKVDLELFRHTMDEIETAAHRAVQEPR